MGPNALSKAMAEFIGTFILVYIGCGAVILTAVPGTNGAAGLLGIAVAFGVTVAAVASSIGHVSGGHINPAVTFALVITKRMEPALAAVYVVAQLAGATFAAYALSETFSPDIWKKVHLGATLPGNGFTDVATFKLETIVTFILVFVIFGTAVDARGPKMGALFIGGTVTVDILMSGPLTGASMNPARTFGPALVSGAWGAHWAYWAGPLLGAGLAALLYDKFLNVEK